VSTFVSALLKKSLWYPSLKHLTCVLIQTTKTDFQWQNTFFVKRQNINASAHFWCNILRYADESGTNPCREKAFFFNVTAGGVLELILNRTNQSKNYNKEPIEIGKG
jgi:hypothetical protein